MARLELRGTVTTMDALLTQRGLAVQILAQGGHYLMVAKENRPAMLGGKAELLEAGAWMPSEIGTRYWEYRSFGKGHGCPETRTLECSTALEGWLDWPGVGQLLRRSTEREIVATGAIERVVTHAVTSLTPHHAGPEELEGYWRGHLGIENRVHHVRELTMGENRGQAYTGGASRTMAALRDGIVGLLRHSGWKSIARALRHYAAHPSEAPALVGAAPVRL